MKRLSTLLSLSALLFLTACQPNPEPTVTYGQNIKNKLKLSHVFIPPSDAYPPYTLLHYLPETGFQQVCEASEITNLSSEEVKEKLVYKNLANSNTYKGSNTSYGVHLGKKGVGQAGINYQDITQLSISLEDGKLVSMPSIHISDVSKIITQSKCSEDIKFFKANQPESKFFIPREVFMYTVKYSIFDKSGTDITAKLAKNLQKIILQNAGINLHGGEVMNMNGTALYVGFKGTPYNNGVVPKGSDESNIIDVTTLVNEIQEK